MVTQTIIKVWNIFPAIVARRKILPPIVKTIPTSRQPTWCNIFEFGDVYFDVSINSLLLSTNSISSERSMKIVAIDFRRKVLPAFWKVKRGELIMYSDVKYHPVPFRA